MLLESLTLARPRPLLASSAHGRRVATAVALASALLGCDVAAPPAAPGACAPPAGLTPLADCLDAGRNAVVGSASCPNAILTGTDLTGANAAAAITIEAGARLVIPDSTTGLDTTGIDVSGSLEIGTAECPVTPANQVTIRFLGAKPAKCDANASPMDPDCHRKGIVVESGGSLLAYGQKGVVTAGGVSWTRLALPAGPASHGPGSGTRAPVTVTDQVFLADDVSKDWRDGDWVVVATTSFAPYDSEFVRLAGAPAQAPAGSRAPLDPQTALRAYHFGGLAPGEGEAGFFDGKATNYGVEERAEVGLVSRSIKLTAEIPADAASAHWGGEIRVLEGFGRVELRGIEIENFGKDQLGSYPLHFHRVGTPANPPVVDSNSIHHSYNKCIVLHDTNGVTIANNVCARIVSHIFYLETGSEAGNTFTKNLGLGAMQTMFPAYVSQTWSDAAKACLSNAPSPGFVPPTRDAVNAHFWIGDYLANPALYPGGAPPLAYDGLYVPNTDDAQANYVRGACYAANGDPQTPNPTPCDADHPIYLEPASGFWITNPTTNLAGNSIGGCQGSGRAFWYLATDANYREPLGTFQNNFAHACNSGLDTASDVGIRSQNLAPQNGANQDLLAVFDGLTATRSRFRGTWLRPNWNVVRGARYATNYESVSLVSSGGTEGTAPGAWAMLSDSVLVGMSENNPGRFGPCTSPNGAGCLCELPNAFTGQGYPTPLANFQGYMYYDGPARIVRNRFVNFRTDISSELDQSDAAYLSAFSSTNTMRFDASLPFQYEGDTAMGWIQSNLQSVPPTQYTQGLVFSNVDLRHQVYTEQVNLGGFLDGDKNTVILDKDGTLTGYAVTGPNGEARRHKFPVSLNNLPFLGADDGASAAFPDNPSTVDECLSTGAQDAVAENRGSSLISPFDYATLETSALTCKDVFPGFSVSCTLARPADEITFVKDTVDYGSHASMALSGRNGNGVYEPKVVDGLGYTLHKDPNGFPRYFSLGFVDASTEDIAANPFDVRVGICLKTQTGTIPPADDCVANPSTCTPNFTVKRGYKSYGGPNGNAQTLGTYWSFLPQCNNLDNAVRDNIPRPGVSGCPSAGAPAASYPVATLTETDDISKVDADHYYYDAAAGILFLRIVQDVPNAVGPSPLGSCQADSPLPCPQTQAEGETFYSCPPEGCVLYGVTIDAASYAPSGPTACAPYGGSGATDGSGGYTMAYPEGTDRLAYVVPAGVTPPDPITNGEIAKNAAVSPNTVRGKDYPHNAPAAGGAPYCPNPALFGGSRFDSDGDGIPNDLDDCRFDPNPGQADADGDLVGDACDDCRLVANADQRDSNGDGFGNRCDPDLDGDGVVNFRDLARMKSVFFTADADADLDGDGVVNFSDLASMKQRFFGAPGPGAQP